MRDVPGGWFIRYMHATGASAFFVVVYFHMFRGVMYGSYKGKRELFAFHVAAVPLILVALVFIHIVALHTVGSNNPDGVEIKKLKDEKGVPLDGIPFHPYYTVHDIPAIAVFLMVFFAVLFFAPEMGGYFLEFANFEPANPLKTPEHIAPVWYFTPFYTVLRAVTLSPFMGTLAMFGAIAALFALPFLDRNPIKSWRYRTTAHLAVLFIDWYRYNGEDPVTAAQIRWQWVWPIGYLVVTLLIPYFVKSWNTEGKVPERVTYEH